MKTITYQGKLNVTFGLSSESKGGMAGQNASFFYEIDTGKCWIYDEANTQWREVPGTWLPILYN